MEKQKESEVQSAGERKMDSLRFPRDKNDLRERCQFGGKERGVWIGSVGVGDQKEGIMRRVVTKRTGICCQCVGYQGLRFQKPSS